MADREKLIELLKEDTCPGLSYEDCAYCKYDGEHDCFYKSQADHLIAAGVTIQETGYWEWDTEDIYKCSHCGDKVHVKEVMGQPDWGFCPACGSKMGWRGCR